MSRDGFAVADTDTAMMSDPKVLALARRLRDPVRTGAALALYDAVRLASWRHGCRLTLDETAPGWWLEPYDDLAGALVAAGLLDDERRIPAHAWESWYGPARDRRDQYRELGRRGGLAKAANLAHAKAEATAHARADGVAHGLARTVPSRPEPSITREDGLPNVNGAIASAWEQATGRSLIGSGRFAAEYLDDAARRHGEPAVAAAIREARQGFAHIPETAVLASSVRRILDPFTDGKAETEQREQARSRRGTERTLRYLHEQGNHADEPHPGCPVCQHDEATA
jgi:hypothetical protein